MFGPVLLLIIGCVLLIMGIVLIVTAISRANRAAEGSMTEGPAPGSEFSRDDEMFGPEFLAPGAVVVHHGVEYVVRGSIHLREGSYRWYEHLLDGGEPGTWLGVEVDEDLGLQLSMWRRNRGAPVPDDAEVVLSGLTYREHERGRAGYRSVGTTGLPSEGVMRYVDYAAREERHKLLGLEKWAEESAWEASFGEAAYRGDFTVYPAPKQGTGGYGGATTSTGVVHGGDVGQGDACASAPFHGDPDAGRPWNGGGR